MQANSDKKNPIHLNINPIQFNVYLGLSTILGFILTNSSINLNVPLWILAILSLFLYVGDFWAFVFKVRTARVRLLFDLSNGKPNKRVGKPIEAGCMMFYGFMMRMILRVILGMAVIMGFGGSLDKDMNGLQMGFMITLVLLEVIYMLYSLYETHIFDASTEDATESEREENWKSEVVWRKKMFLKLRDPQIWKKELAANIILFITATVFTQLFWGNMNREFIDSLIRAEKFGDSITFEVVGILISTTVLCFFFLLPVRLAFWVEARMKAESPPEKKKYRWSIVFAGLMIISPTLVQIIKTVF